MFEEGWERRWAARSPDLADLQRRLTPWLGDRRITHLEHAEGGLANATSRVEVEGWGSFSVRLHTRDPASADKEAALLGRMRELLPVPEIVFRVGDGETPITVSRWLPGERLWEVFPGLDATGCRELGRDCGEALATIGARRFAESGFLDRDLQVETPLGPLREAFEAYCEGGMEAGAAEKLGPDLAAAIRRAFREQGDLVDSVDGDPRLVHGDFKGSNLLASRRAGTWQLTGVLDWEFAFAGPALFDVGQLTRWHRDLDPAFEEGFAEAFVAEGELLPRHWQQVSALLDLVNLCGFLANDEETPIRDRAVVELVRGSRALNP